MAQTVFITGASGYVGRHVAREFVRRGFTVAGLVRSRSAAQTVEALGASAIYGDLENPKTYKTAAMDADVIVHAGFSYTQQGAERSDIDRTATEALLQFAAASGKARFLIYTASVFRYGPGGEEFANEITAVPVDPADWRHELEERVLASASGKLRTAVVRLAWVYGSDGGTLAQAVIPLASKVLSPEIVSNRIPFVHVEDVAHLYAEVTEGEGGIIHGCSGRPITVGELAKIAKTIKLKIPAPSAANKEHFALAFERDTPATSLYMQDVSDVAKRLADDLSEPNAHTFVA